MEQIESAGVVQVSLYLCFDCMCCIDINQILVSLKGEETEREKERESIEFFGKQSQRQFARARATEVTSYYLTSYYLSI